MIRRWWDERPRGWGWLPVVGAFLVLCWIASEPPAGVAIAMIPATAIQMAIWAFVRAQFFEPEEAGR